MYCISIRYYKLGRDRWCCGDGALDGDVSREVAKDEEEEEDDDEVAANGVLMLH